MIYITGDVHADVERFKTPAFKKLGRHDTLIICGDFGFVWNGSAQEQKVLKWLERRRYTILFVEGTHDNLDLLEKYPVVEYQGGQARQIGKRCFQLMRGEVYEIESERIFAFGGGQSDDMEDRMAVHTWFPKELPSREELQNARENLARYNHSVDYIITHQASTTVNDFLYMDKPQLNPLSSFLDEVSKTVQYKYWFFGCYHMDKLIPPKHAVVYQNLLPLKVPI